MYHQLLTCNRLPSLEQILELVAGVGDLSEPHHPTRAFESVQLTQQPGRGVLVIVVFRCQLEDPLEAVTGLVEEEREQFRVFQIFVQFRRLTSTPRVPTISPAGFFTATAIVKHGSPVNRES